MRAKQCLLNLWMLVLIFVAATATAQAATIYGVSFDNQLVRFDSATPGAVSAVGAITGLQTNEQILGIDFRPLTGQLFALGSTGRLYTINKNTGAATFVAQLSVALQGNFFGFDFNPQVDRIRIVSDTGQNLRVNPENGSVTVDTPLNPGTPNITGAAYNNNFSGTDSTTLYVIDYGTNSLYVQNPPNNGTLTLVGALGVNPTASLGFDFDSGSNTAYALFNVSGAVGLYSVNTTNGGASFIGNIGTTGLASIAVEIGATPGYIVYGLTTANTLIKFNAARPTDFLSIVNITGLQTNEIGVGIDFRPASGQIYLVTNQNRLYTVNPINGATTVVGTLTTALSGIDHGVDFNPVVDRLRIVNDADQNLRANPPDATNVVDTPLAYAAGDANAGQNPNVTAAAYTNNFAGATSTTLYDIDSNLDVLATQNPPNNGTLNTVGKLGYNTTENVGLDIATGSNTALAAIQINGEVQSKLFVVNLTNGSAAFVAPIGQGPTTSNQVRSIAIAYNPRLDFDGDRRSDFAVFRPTNNFWYVQRSSNGTFFGQQFGVFPSDVRQPGDYDGDGRTDIAVWRQADGVWYVLRSTDNTLQATQWGRNGDFPFAADYDGDGKTDFAVVRSENGVKTWFIYGTNTLPRAVQFGLSDDRAVPGDYDGDGQTDLTVFRGAQSNPATFYVLQSRLGFRAVQWGIGSDIVAPGDYDGDGSTDFTVLRDVAGQRFWYILQTSTNTPISYQWGTPNDYVVQGDYDGDGRDDVAVWNFNNGYFYVLRSANGGILQQQFGQNGDIALANRVYQFP